MRIVLAVALISVVGCKEPTEGTFIGNPSLTTRVAPSNEYTPRGGLVDALEVHVRTCEGDGLGGDLPLGPFRFDMTGEVATQSIQIPEGSFCGLFFVMKELTVVFDDGGANQTTVTAENFDIILSIPFEASQGGTYVLRLADEAWLTALAQHSVPGPNNVEDNPDLHDAFISGLEDDSAVTDAAGDPATPSAGLAGRVDLLGQGPSPNFLGPTVEDCWANTQFHMAVPIPPASMDAVGLGQEMGWCEGAVRFSSDLEVLTSYQTDHSDQSTYPVRYNGWGFGCEGLHCNQVVSASGEVLPRSCTVLAECGSDEAGVVAGFEW